MILFIYTQKKKKNELWLMQTIYQPMMILILGLKLKKNHLNKRSSTMSVVYLSNGRFLRIEHFLKATNFS